MAKVILGALVGVIGTHIFHYWTRRQEYSKVRAAIKIEAGRNDKALREFWDKADQEPSDIPFGTGTVIDMLDSAPIVRTLTEIPPKWSLKIWETHITTAALAYKPSIFNRIYQFYENLPEIVNIYSQLTAPEFETYDNALTKIKHGELWVELERLVRETNELARSIKGHEAVEGATLGDLIIKVWEYLKKIRKN